MNYELRTMNCIQIMSVNPGFQGSKFLPETLKKIRALRQLDYGSDIYLDGGINERTIPIIKSQKDPPDFLCIGSFLTKSIDPKKTTEDLKKALIY